MYLSINHKHKTFHQKPCSYPSLSYFKQSDIRIASEAIIILVLFPTQKLGLVEKIVLPASSTTIKIRHDILDCFFIWD